MYKKKDKCIRVKCHSNVVDLSVGPPALFLQCSVAGLRSEQTDHPELMATHGHSYFPNRPKADGPAAVSLTDTSCYSPFSQDRQTGSDHRGKRTADVHAVILKLCPILPLSPMNTLVLLNLLKVTFSQIFYFSLVYYRFSNISFYCIVQ